MRHLRAVLPALAVAATVLIGVDPSMACASNHINAQLSWFPAEAVTRPLYWVVENAGPARFSVRVFGTSCDGTTVSIDWAIQDHTTDGAQDYTSSSGNITIVNGPGHQDTQTRDIGLVDDFGLPADDPVERAEIVLTSATNARLIFPSQAPLFILDDDAPVPQVSIAEGPYTQSESQGPGGVAVFMGGSGSTSVNYTISPGASSPATPGTDFTAQTSGTLSFSSSDRAEVIPLTVVDDALREGIETFTVSISGAAVTGTSSVSFSIFDNEEGAPPTSQLHHPREQLRYPVDDYRIREIHVFTGDTGGSGVKDAELAIRQNKKDGSCEWYTGKGGFEVGDCAKQRWLSMSLYQPDFFLRAIDRFPGSAGKIVDYTAFSRAIDHAGNVEQTFDVGRNKNNFEIEGGQQAKKKCKGKKGRGSSRQGKKCGKKGKGKKQPMLDPAAA